MSLYPVKIPLLLSLSFSQEHDIAIICCVPHDTAAGGDGELHQGECSSNRSRRSLEAREKLQGKRNQWEDIEIGGETGRK